jgi:hypothetical protein
MLQHCQEVTYQKQCPRRGEFESTLSLPSPAVASVLRVLCMYCVFAGAWIQWEDFFYHFVFVKVPSGTCSTKVNMYIQCGFPVSFPFYFSWKWRNQVSVIMFCLLDKIIFCFEVCTRLFNTIRLVKRQCWLSIWSKTGEEPEVRNEESLFITLAQNRVIS